MTRPVRPDAAAEAEILAARRWYEGRQEGLGDELLDSLAETVGRIEAAPESCALVQGKFSNPVRSVRVKRLPYRVAVVHTRMEPGYWRDRLSPSG